MARIPVDEAPAGPAMDAAVARALGWLPYESDGVWYWKDMSDDDFPYWDHHAGGYGYVEDLKPWSPSTDIAAAWEVHRAACAMLFTKRKTYFRAIQEQTRLEDGSLVAWPDVLMTLVEIFPEAICRAFLKASGVTHVETPDEI